LHWIESITKALHFIENNLTQNICVDDVADNVYASGAHFQRIFHLVTGYTIGDYLRNRRLSEAAHDIAHGQKLIDVAFKYQYDTQEGFSKAFTRFHGITPKQARKGKCSAKFFHPLKINITIEGGFSMTHDFTDKLLLIDWSEVNSEIDAEDAYRMIGHWALAARCANPMAFDELSAWILDDIQWTTDKLAENEQILMGVLTRFKEQNARLREYLKELEPSGVVNPPVFAALDRFDDELSGAPHDERLRETVAMMFADFTVMKERAVREKIAGGITGSAGTSTVSTYGYINFLKGCDAQIQWCLFMPDWVKQQQKGFKVASFEYQTLPAVRFIGREDTFEGKVEIRREIFNALDDLHEYQSGFAHDLLFMHHYGKGVDVEPWHGFWGRFMQAGTPVPEDFVHWDLVPDDSNTPYLTFCSQCAYAQFSGDTKVMHETKGFDSDAMYDVTRNIILGQGVHIPYPETYWTAEVFLDGHEKPGTAYLFSAKI